MPGRVRGRSTTSMVTGTLANGKRISQKEKAFTTTLMVTGSADECFLQDKYVLRYEGTFSAGKFNQKTLLILVNVTLSERSNSFKEILD